MSACDSCSSKGSCESKESCPSFIEENKRNPDIKVVVGIASGKGGVGKSFVTSMLAVELMRKGLQVGILDADVTGPSIPQAFGLHDTLYTDDNNKIIPATTPEGIKVVSLNLLLEEETTPVIWRGPVISGVVKQFWEEVTWGPLDVLLIDMPPGTGDVPLTVFQSIAIDGLVIVSTPQDLVSMIVTKAYNMASMMNVNVLGLVENMSYVKCPHCDEKISLFGNDMGLKKTCEEHNITILDKLPLDSESTSMVDSGRATKVFDVPLGATIEAIEKLL